MLWKRGTKKEEAREESGKEEREKKWMPIKREEAWEKEILALRYDSGRSQWVRFLYGFVPSVCTQLVDCKPRESANRKLSLPLQRSKALWTAGILYSQITYCDTHSIWAVPQYRSQLFLARTSVVLSKSPSLTCGTVPHQMYQVINSLESLRWKSRAGEKDSLVYMPQCRRDIQLIIILLGLLWIAEVANSVLGDLLVLC